MSKKINYLKYKGGLYVQEILTRTRVKQLYGHSYTEQEIKRKYPYSNIKLKTNPTTTNRLYTTYNPYTAMQMKLKNTPCYVWGAKAKDGKSVFIFRQENRNKLLTF